MSKIIKACTPRVMAIIVCIAYIMSVLCMACMSASNWTIHGINGEAYLAYGMALTALLSLYNAVWSYWNDRDHCKIDYVGVAVCVLSIVSLLYSTHVSFSESEPFSRGYAIGESLFTTYILYSLIRTIPKARKVRQEPVEATVKPTETPATTNTQN